MAVADELSLKGHSLTEASFQCIRLTDFFTKKKLGMLRELDEVFQFSTSYNTYIGSNLRQSLKIIYYRFHTILIPSNFIENVIVKTKPNPIGDIR